jgi:hypothetical protein
MSVSVKREPVKIFWRDIPPPQINMIQSPQQQMQQQRQMWRDETTAVPSSGSVYEATPIRLPGGEFKVIRPREGTGGAEWISEDELVTWGVNTQGVLCQINPYLCDTNIFPAYFEWLNRKGLLNQLKARCRVTRWLDTPEGRKPVGYSCTPEPGVVIPPVRCETGQKIIETAEPFTGEKRQAIVTTGRCWAYYNGVWEEFWRNE